MEKLTFRNRMLAVAGRVVVALLAVLSVACGGDSSSPSEPDPVPFPVALAGTWQGQMTSRPAGGGEVVCNLQVEMTETNDPAVLGARWDASCGDGTSGNGRWVVTGPFIGQVLFISFDAEPFGGCGWSGGATQVGDRLNGEWSVVSNCASQRTGQWDVTKID